MKKTPIYAVAAAIILLSTGCETIKNTTRKATQTVSSVIPKHKAESAEPKSVTPPPAVAEEIAREQSQDYTTVIPFPEQSAVADTAATQVAADNVGAAPVEKVELTPLAASLEGEWQIIQVGTHVIDRDEDMPYIVFEPATASFYANNGCNTLNGMFTLDGRDVITFHNVLSTMRLCQDTTFDNEINVIISDNAETALKMSTIGKETYVDFVTPSGKIIMRLRRGNLDFLNGNWEVESISGLSKLEVPADIFFDLGELKLHGNTGCNYVNGTIYLDHRRSNAVDFSNMITTRMACPYNDQQTAMLVALEQTESAISDGADRVMFLDANGRNLMTLRRAANQNPDFEE